jgi:hypothetical protein
MKEFRLGDQRTSDELVGSCVKWKDREIPDKAEDVLKGH